MWITLADISETHALRSRRSSSREEYIERLHTAADEAAKISWTELIHLLIIAFDFTVASFAVFYRNFSRGFISQFQLALGTPLGFAVCLRLLTWSRRSIVLQQRESTSEFATGVLRVMLIVGAGQIIYGARFAGFHLLRTDISPVCDVCDSCVLAEDTAALVRLSNRPGHQMWYAGAPVFFVSNCSADFVGLPDRWVVQNTSADATFMNQRMNEYILCQGGSMCVMFYMIAVPLVYFTAKGQGILSRYATYSNFELSGWDVTAIILLTVASAITLLVAIKM